MNLLKTKSKTKLSKEKRETLKKIQPEYIKNVINQIADKKLKRFSSI